MKVQYSIHMPASGHTMGPLKALIPQKHISSHLEDTRKGMERKRRRDGRKTWKENKEIKN
jgi:hypothetical protein